MNQPARTDDGEEQTHSARRPEYTAKHGNVEIAIWKNHAQNGDFYSASSPRISYKDNAAGGFKEGSSYGRHDLLDLAEAAREAAGKIRDLQKAKNQGQSR